MKKILFYIFIFIIFYYSFDAIKKIADKQNHKKEYSKYENVETIMNIEKFSGENKETLYKKCGETLSVEEWNNHINSYQYYSMTTYEYKNFNFTSIKNSLIETLYSFDYYAPIKSINNENIIIYYICKLFNIDIDNSIELISKSKTNFFFKNINKIYKIECFLKNNETNFIQIKFFEL